MPHFGPKKTLDPSNQYCFTCPIFGADTRIAECFELRDRHARGEKVEVRRGCQAALLANKCPIPHVLGRMIRSGVDPYHSPERKVGRLDAVDLDRIAPILVPDKIMDQYMVDGAARRALIDANEKAGKGVRTPPKRAKAAPARMDVIPTPAATEPQADDADILAAAAAGDLAAAVNAAPASAPETAPPAAPELPSEPEPPKQTDTTSQPETRPASAPASTAGMSLLEIALQKKEQSA